jgi:Family of unknown function (DUF5690)
LNLKTYLLKNEKLVPWVAGFAAFFTYLFFYPFRRAYTAATYTPLAYWGIDFKILMITAQVLGFAVSKGIGIKIVSEMKALNRAFSMALMLGIATVFYGLFAIVPAPYSLVFIFLANLPLGMFYGTILGFLEGRRVTEFLVAVLTGSFIIGSGFAKSIGAWVVESLHVTVFFMPVVAAGLMLLPVCFFIYLLSCLPLPNAQDIQERVARVPMNTASRAKFIGEYRWGIVFFVCSYVLLTAFREFRDNFTPEIWQALGNTDSKIFTKTEIPIALAVMAIMVSLNFIPDNYKAFVVIENLMLAGGVLILLFTFLFQFGYITPFVWLTGIGLGAYIAYAMSNSLYFERMIGAFKSPGTVGFLITMADYYAYFGSITVLLIKNYVPLSISFVSFFIVLSYVIGVLYILLILGSRVYYGGLKKGFKG